MYRLESCSRSCILSLFFTPAPSVDEVYSLTHPHVSLPPGFPNPLDRQKVQILWKPVPTQRRKFHISAPIKGRKHSLSQEVVGCIHLWANIHLARGQLPLLAWRVWGEERRGEGYEDAKQSGNSLQHWPRFASIGNLVHPHLDEHFKR